MTGHTTRHAFVDSPIGTLTLIADGDAIVEVWFPNHADGPTASLDDSTLDPDHPVLVRTSTQLAEYFAGTRTAFDLPLAPEGTPFQLAAWRALSTIPFGETVSYGEQASRLGDPNKARAVGAANGRNPIPIIVPCHRVIGANGRLTGFGGGVESKAWLLDHEQRVRQEAVA
jgi:methylated-DNA-[protein]-cysteine S-methyltransferase